MSPPPKRRATLPGTNEMRRSVASSRANAVTLSAGVGTDSLAPGRVNEYGGANDDLSPSEVWASSWPWVGFWPQNSSQGQRNPQIENPNEWLASGHSLHDAPTRPFISHDGDLADWLDAPASKGQSDGTVERSFQQPADSMREQNLHVDSVDDSSNSSGFSPIQEETFPLVDSNRKLSSGIAQLTQLSTRLYPLGCSSKVIAASAPGSPAKRGVDSQGYRDSAIDGTVFQMIMTPILEGDSSMNSSTSGLKILGSSTVGNTLRDAVSASREFLEILDCISKLGLSSQPSTQNSIQPLAPNSADGYTKSRFGHLKAPNSTYSALMQTGTSSPTTESQSSNTVIRHLIMACHEMLLSTYTDLLGVMQHDASYMLSKSNPTEHGRRATIETAPLTDIRLVITVQLCSYLIARQQQAVHQYFSLQHSSAESAGTLEAPTVVAPQSHHEIEVQKLLTCLRRALRI
ncbi:hypothetical protein F5X97DRAFT_327179 [Nemania serpens]|nr:hypothetical protein F5X97DRAFT_327179 [Nemania serpens]